jgi:hypothetical protein
MERTEEILKKVSFLYEKYPDDWVNRTLMLFDHDSLKRKIEHSVSYARDNNTLEDVIFNGVQNIISMYYIEESV